MAKLIIFVHGLGANGNDWWGSTKSLLIEKYKKDNNIDIYFYDYKTEKVSGLINKAKLFFGNGSNLADLNNLGALLALDINNYIRKKNKQYEEIKFFGHSMGGIVIASCLWYMRIKNINYHKVSSVVFCGTPLGGSKIATRIDNILWFKTSKHVKLLRYNNKYLKNIVNNLSSIVTIYPDDNKPLLTFFEIVDDEVVQSDEEKFGPYNKDNVESFIIKIQGGHVGAIQNLLPNSSTFLEIEKWIEYGNIEKGIEEEQIEHFRRFIYYQSSFSNKIGISKLKLKEMYLEYMNKQNKKRSYIDLSIHARRTYLYKRTKDSDYLAITDFKRTVKVIDNTRDCIFEIKNGFLKESKYGQSDELKKIIELLKDEDRVRTVDRFSNIVLNLGFRINGGQKLFKPNSVEIETYETERYNGFNIICNLGEKAVGNEIEFLASITLPVTIFDFPTEKDIFNFPVTTYDRKYIIQEEIYGNNSPKLEPNEISGVAEVYKEKDRSLYYNRYIFSSIDDKNFNKVEISYSMK